MRSAVTAPKRSGICAPDRYHWIQQIARNLPKFAGSIVGLHTISPIASPRSHKSSLQSDVVARAHAQLPPSEAGAQVLADLRARHGVPGAALGVSLRRLRRTFTSGETTVRGGAAVTDDTLFQIGSLTKTFTATLLVRLAASRGVGLDEPLRSWVQPEALPDFLAATTIRQLLSHTAGIDADVGLDLGYAAEHGRGDDCVDRFVASLTSDVLLKSPELARYSYSNTGYAIAGWLSSQLAGMSWDVALREELLDPIGAANTVTLPEEAIVRPIALGHTRRGGSLCPSSRWHVSRALGPAGGILSTVLDMLAFLELHLSDGRLASGDELLKASAAVEMRRPHVEVGLAGISAFGLGWCVGEWGGVGTLFHFGDTLGHEAVSCIIPSLDMAVVVLANSNDSTGFVRDVLAWALQSHGIRLSFDAPPTGTRSFTGADDLLGTYARANVSLEIGRRADSLVMLKSVSPGLSKMWSTPEAETYELAPEGGGVFRIVDNGRAPEFVVFTQSQRDRWACLHMALRAHERLGA